MRRFKYYYVESKAPGLAVVSVRGLAYAKSVADSKAKETGTYAVVRDCPPAWVRAQKMDPGTGIVYVAGGEGTPS